MTAQGEPGSEAAGTDPPAGLAALHAALAAAAEHRGLAAFAIAVHDPDLGRQVFAAGADAGAAFAALAAETSATWWASPTPHDPPNEVDALRAFATTALRLATAGADPDPTAAVEVALRRDPAVAAVERRHGLLRAAVPADDPAAIEARLATAVGSGPAALVVLRTAASGRAPGTNDASRVALVAVRTMPETGELEVHLGLGDRRTVGRGPLAGAGPAAAAATLSALVDVDPRAAGAGFRVAWVRTVDTTPDRRFLVAVALGRDADGPCYGIAAGSSPVEAAARAALHAANRVVGA